MADKRRHGWLNNNKMEQNQVFEQLISQYGGDNPRFQQMLAMMQQSKAAQSEAIEEEEPPIERELAAYKNKLSKAVSKIRQLTSEVEELNEGLNAMVQFSEDLAHAVGACTFCWGEDPSCRACRGRGKPGVFEPDSALFERFVAPAWHRSKAKLQ